MKEKRRSKSITPRILQLANEAGPLRLFVLPVCDALRDTGATVELACMAGGPHFEPLRATGYPLHTLPPGSWKNPFTYIRLYGRVRKLLQQERYDLMIVHTPVMSWIARLAARDCIDAKVYMAHGLSFPPHSRNPKYFLLRKVEEYFAKYTDGLIIMNHADEISCTTYLLVHPEGRWFKVPGVGVDVDVWAAPQSDVDYRPAENLVESPPEKPMILYLGRFLKTKGIPVIMELARRIGPQANFVLAGNGPLWKKTRDWAEVHAPHVRVLDWVEHPRDLMRQCTLAVFPSAYLEGIPRFVLEAQAAGKPVVAYDYQGAQDIILSGETGLLVPPGNVDALCDAVQHLLADSNRCRQMGTAGQQRVRAVFSLKASVDAQMAAIEWILRKQRKSFSTIE